MSIEDLIVLAVLGGVGWLVWTHVSTPAIAQPIPGTVGTIGAVGSCSYTGSDGKTYQGILASGYSGNLANLNGCSPVMTAL
jgi:hypothetical protein